MKLVTIDKEDLCKKLEALTEGYLGSSLYISRLVGLAEGNGFNQREINPKKVEKLIKSISTLGRLVEPVIVSVDSDGNPIMVVSGRHRIEALGILSEVIGLDFRVPVVLQQYGHKPEELLATNQSRRFQAWESLQIRRDADPDSLKPVEHNKLALLEFLRESPVVSETLSRATLLKVAHYIIKENLEASHFRSALEELLNDTEQRAELPSNLARYWKVLADKVMNSII